MRRGRDAGRRGRAPRRRSARSPRCPCGCTRPWSRPACGPCSAAEPRFHRVTRPAARGPTQQVLPFRRYTVRGRIGKPRGGASCRWVGDPVEAGVQPPSSARRPALTSVACSRTDSAATSRIASSARPPPPLRCRRSGATTCSNSPASRSAAFRKARRCRGSIPKRRARRRSPRPPAPRRRKRRRPARRAARTTPAPRAAPPQPGRAEQLLAAHPDVERLRHERSAPGTGTAGTARGPRAGKRPDPAPAARARGRSRRGAP